MSLEAELCCSTPPSTSELAAYDSPGFKDRQEAAERGAQVSQDLIQEGQDILSALASLAAGAAVLTAVHPVAAAAARAGRPAAGRAQVSGAREAYLATLATMGHRRMLGVLRWHLTEPTQRRPDPLRHDGRLPARHVPRDRRARQRHRRAGRPAAAPGCRWSARPPAVSPPALVWTALVLLLATGRLSVASAGTAIFALRTGQRLRAGRWSSAAPGCSAPASTSTTGRDFLTRPAASACGAARGRPDGPVEVRAEKLTYRYEGAARDALHDVTLDVRRGEVLALVGENGSGKTTLSKLLTALYLPTSGRVTWDGADLRDLDPARRLGAASPWSRRTTPVAAVRPAERHAGPAARPAATPRCAPPAEASGADEVVDGLRSGLDTLLAREWLGGEELSGGQWQRVAIARAFHRPAGLLVMDEPTAALDARAEHRIFTGLRRIAADRAVVLVTHRLANVAIADRIVVLERGRVIQDGTFAELRRRRRPVPRTVAAAERPGRARAPDHRQPRLTAGVAAAAPTGRRGAAVAGRVPGGGRGRRAGWGGRGQALQAIRLSSGTAVRLRRSRPIT